MQGPAGVARLAAESGESKTKIVIDAENVTKRFGDRAILKDLTLRVQRGDRIGIVGAYGTGKTTLLRLMIGELEPDEGTVRRANTLDRVVIGIGRASCRGRACQDVEISVVPGDVKKKKKTNSKET